MPQGGGVGGRNLIIIKWTANYALIWIFFTSTYPSTTRTPHSIFDPLPPKRGYLWIFTFLKIDQIQWAGKYALMWKQMYKHIPWDHPYPPITFLPPLPQMGGNYEFSFFWKIKGGCTVPPSISLYILRLSRSHGKTSLYMSVPITYPAIDITYTYNT